MVLVAAFGLPTCAHEDDATRAVKAALQARERLQALGLRSSIGIATGRVCCGLRGGARRHEYAVMGQTVNLAARLMQEARDGILFDEATALASAERLWTERLPPVKVKGVAEAIALYRPGGSSEARTRRMGDVLVGRAQERATVDESLTCFAKGQGGTLVVEGEAGIGKSRLLAYVAQAARSRGARLLAGRGDAAEPFTVYYAWRPIFADWLGLASAVSGEERRVALLARLAMMPETLELAPLLNPVFLLSLPETERTARLRDQARAETTLALMVQLLMDAGPSVLLLEDAHWMDASSWELLKRLSRDAPDWWVVLSTRPYPDDPPPAFAALCRMPTTQKLRLAAMSRDDCISLVCARLGVVKLQDELAAFILRKAEGHPFYCEELAYTLRDKGLLVAERGECRLSSLAGSLDALALPSTLEGLITSRIDQLTPVQQLTLKAASVIGRTFEWGLLKGVHPLPEERERLAAHLLRLHTQDLALPLGSHPEPSYFFKHVITQEVSYNLLLFSQRRQLHEDVARWYERTQGEALAALQPLLAHHWIRANVRTKALEALEKAGEHAMAVYAPSEAVGFFSNALALESEGPERVDALRLARWERMLGRALRCLGQSSAAWPHLSRALELLGFPLPVRRGALTVGTVLGMVRQAVGWLGRLRGRQVRVAEVARLVEAVEACSDLALLAYYSLDLSTLGYVIVRMANLADRSGVASLRARAYAALAMVMGSIPLHRVAEAYSRASQALAKDADDLEALSKARLTFSLYLLEAGRFAEAEVTIEQSIAGFNQLGHARLADEARLLKLNLWIFQGRLDEAQPLVEAVGASALKRDDAQMVRWAKEDLGRVLVRKGQWAKATEPLTTLAHDLDALSVTSFAGCMSLTWLRLGQLRQARETAESQAERILRTPLSVTVLDGYTGMAETFQELWALARAQGEPDAAMLERSARRFCEALERGARACVVAVPSARLARGRLHLAVGRHRAARRSFEAAKKAALDLGMPHEAAAARALLAGVG
nr:AAA family ATPase [Corallococcus exiguus]